MNVQTTTEQKISPEDLAKTLSKCTPSEFASFWFEFAASCGEDSLNEFAKAMAPTLGSKRKEPLTKLARMINYYELKEIMEVRICE